LDKALAAPELPSAAETSGMEEGAAAVLIGLGRASAFVGSTDRSGVEICAKVTGEELTGRYGGASQRADQMPDRRKCTKPRGASW
jgi:hypothetical protein